MLSNYPVYRLGGVGDIVVGLLALHLIARAFPDAERMMLTNWPVSSKAAAAERTLANSGLLHRHVAYPVGLRDPYVIHRLIMGLWAEEW